MTPKSTVMLHFSIPVNFRQPRFRSLVVLHDSRLRWTNLTEADRSVASKKKHGAPFASFQAENLVPGTSMHEKVAIALTGSSKNGVMSCLASRIGRALIEAGRGAKFTGQ
jgi:hypothetical protein